MSDRFRARDEHTQILSKAYGAAIKTVKVQHLLVPLQVTRDPEHLGSSLSTISSTFSRRYALPHFGVSWLTLSRRKGSAEHLLLASIVLSRTHRRLCKRDIPQHSTPTRNLSRTIVLNRPIAVSPSEKKTSDASKRYSPPDFLASIYPDRTQFSLLSSQQVDVRHRRGRRSELAHPLIRFPSSSPKESSYLLWRQYTRLALSTRKCQIKLVSRRRRLTVLCVESQGLGGNSVGQQSQGKVQTQLLRPVKVKIYRLD